SSIGGTGVGRSANTINKESPTLIVSKPRSISLIDGARLMPATPGVEVGGRFVPAGTVALGTSEDFDGVLFVPAVPGETAANCCDEPLELGTSANLCGVLPDWQPARKRPAATIAIAGTERAHDLPFFTIAICPLIEFKLCLWTC